MTGFNTLKEFFDYISQDTAYFFGFILVFLITGSFTVKILEILVTKGIVKILKSIFSGVKFVWDYITKEKK